ncbi:XRE family transcriptional regulator [candidate division WWE3 bacterium CG_4_9_14_3_um_filter_34_6]|uniref:XRE family transcriptional regulator n=1 Tax=candidate division WWE3 bacterium CG_4_9_14_3_um_filter_34_6 TaxID=1975079 RepID=A0A2M7X468_UNCKA|nr:MAG: XRE family transcriptional regulator [candidate division WWE3 bacterium CG_4_9_14_3_um_filter_34_6]
MSTDIAKKIKQARLQANLSQLELSKALSVSEKAVSSYESGRTNPSIDTLFRIAKRTNTPIAYFTNQENEDFELTSKLMKIQAQLDEIKIMIERRDLLGATPDKVGGSPL